MTIASRLSWFLRHEGQSYELVHHPRTESSAESADAAHVSPATVAKPVLLEDERGYVLAVLPASRRIAFDKLKRGLNRQLALATEAELPLLFDDCALGAVPPIATPYKIPAIIDESLLRLSDVYFEAGDHEHLVHMSGRQFLALMGQARFVDFAQPPPRGDYVH